MKIGKLEIVGIKYGLITTLGLIAFFLLMALVGLVDNYNLRSFNGIILSAGVFLGMRKYKRQQKEKFTSIGGTGVGVIISLVSAVLFAIFIFTYLKLSPGFMKRIIEQLGFPSLTELALAAIIFFEGAFSGMVFTYLVLLWLNRPRADEEVERKKHEVSH